MKIALVTGASSGLGREFVRQIAEQGRASSTNRCAMMQEASAGGIGV